MSSPTTQSQISSGEVDSVLDELHCGLSGIRCPMSSQTLSYFEEEESSSSSGYVAASGCAGCSALVTVSDSPREGQ